MFYDRFQDAAFNLAITGPGSAALSHILNVASHLTAAPSALIVARTGKRHLLLAVKGFARLHAGMELPFEFGHELAYRGPLIVSDTAALAVYRRDEPAPPWRWMAAVPVHLPAFPGSIALVCSDHREKVSRPADILSNLSLLAPGIAHIIELLGLLASETERWQSAERDSRAPEASAPLFAFAESRVASPPPPAFASDRKEASDDGALQGAAVVRNFLTESLVSNVRFLQRDGLGFHALRRWRAPIKQWQLLAVKQLKQARDPLFADMIADEVAESAVTLHGRGSAACVAAVPCGHSGSGCLSEMIAKRVAERLDLPFVEAFEPIAVKGSSHPRRNASRPAMRSALTIREPVLLVDDIATTGSHIVEAKRRLRETSPAVFPLVWLANI